MASENGSNEGQLLEKVQYRFKGAGSWHQSGQDEGLVDSNGSFPACNTTDGKPVPIAAFGAVAGHLETMSTFEAVLEHGPTKVSTHQQDWTRPASPFTAAAQAKGDSPIWELYERGERPLRDQMRGMEELIVAKLGRDGRPTVGLSGQPAPAAGARGR